MSSTYLYHSSSLLLSSICLPNAFRIRFTYSFKGKSFFHFPCLPLRISLENVSQKFERKKNEQTPNTYQKVRNRERVTSTIPKQSGVSAFSIVTGHHNLPSGVNVDCSIIYLNSIFAKQSKRVLLAFSLLHSWSYRVVKTSNFCSQLKKLIGPSAFDLFRYRCPFPTIFSRFFLLLFLFLLAIHR